MSNDYDRLLQYFNVPAGVLTNYYLRMLREGGIRLDDYEYPYVDYSGHSGEYLRDNTQPILQRYPQQGALRVGLGLGVGVEMEGLKRVYEEELSKKDKQLRYLENELNHRTQVFEAEKRRIDSEHELQHYKMMTELRQARAQVVRTYGQIPLIKYALNQVREMLSGVSSYSVYLRLKDLPERYLPPSEWMMVNVWYLIYPYKKYLDYSKKYVSKLRYYIKILHDKHHSLLNEQYHYSRLLSSKDDDVKRYALNYDNSRKSLYLYVDKLRYYVELLREKGARYDYLLRDYQMTKQEKYLIQEKISYYDKQTQSVTGVKGSVEENQRRKLDLLVQDKYYLTKENIQLIEKNRRLYDRLDRLYGELLSYKNRSQEYLHQLLNLKTDSVSGYYQKIYRYISYLKEKHHHYLEMSKNNLVDIYEKQLRFLKEAMEEKEIRLDVSERALREKNKEYEQLMIDTRDFQRKFYGDLSETRIQLKIRSEELERVSHVYQYTLGNLNAHKLENDMLREKLNVVKGEYYRAESSGKDELSSAKAQIAVLKEQLANYEVIEKEIDEAVMSMAKLSPNDNAIVNSTLHSIPTSNKRRIQQALGLAQRLQAKQRYHYYIQGQLHTREQYLQQATDELKIARSLLYKTNQPYSYLVNNIYYKYKYVLMLRGYNRKQQQAYDNLKEEYRVVKRQLYEAEKDVQRLLIKRESIQHIQGILVELTRGPVSATQLGYAVEEIREILGSNAMKRTGQLQMPEQDYKEEKGKESAWYRKLVEKKKNG